MLTVQQMESDAEHIEPERDIKLLLEKHAALLAEVKGAMAKELDPAVHDDIFLLRYILSYKTLEKVRTRVCAARTCCVAPQQQRASSAVRRRFDPAATLPRQLVFFRRLRCAGGRPSCQTDRGQWSRALLARVFPFSKPFVLQTLQHVRGGIEYRKNNPYLKLAHENKEYPLEQEVRKWTAADYHNTTLDGGPVHVIRAGLANVSGLYSSLSVKDIVEEMTLKKEEAYIMCDRVTRESGRLTKQIVIMDFANQGA